MMNSYSSICGSQTVDITGLGNPSDVSNVISEFPYWTQIYIPETLSIPSQKPDIESLNSINISVNIIRSQVIKTPKPLTNEVEVNLEGKILTGRKLVVEGELCQKISYTSCTEEQSVHSAHFYMPFSAYIVVPLEIAANVFGDSDITSPVDSLDIDYQINACVEDVTARVLDDRTIIKQVTFLLYAVPTVNN